MDTDFKVGDWIEPIDGINLSDTVPAWIYDDKYNGVSTQYKIALIKKDGDIIVESGGSGWEANFYYKDLLGMGIINGNKNYGPILRHQLKYFRTVNKDNFIIL